MDTSQRLFVKDIAARRNTSLTAARAWLASLERKGSSAVRRLGRKLYTTEDAIRSLEPHAETSIAEERFAALEQRVSRELARHSARIAHLARDVREIRDRA